jgi:1-phosphofructokinase
MTTDGKGAGGIAVFAPVTILTITLERASDGHEEVHVHPGGQGVWQARMARTLGAPVTLCTLLGGEPGAVLDGLLDGEGLDHPRVEMSAPSPTWIHDRREGERVAVWESSPFTIGRHELDELFSATLAAAMRRGVCVLAGTHEGVGALEPDTYRRLVGDLRAADVSVVIDLTGDELANALESEPDLVKVSDEDMLRAVLQQVLGTTPELGAPGGVGIDAILDAAMSAWIDAATERINDGRPFAR